MANFHSRFEWLDRLMPEGIPIPSSMVISGPGGSGKPLIGLAFVASWLCQGGKVIFVPIQFPDRTYTENDLVQLYRVRLSDYVSSFFFVKLDIDLDPETGVIEQTGPNEVRANLVNPETWTRVLDQAEQAVRPSDLGTLVFSSGLNLLLFSPTYGERMLSRLESMLREDKSRTYLFMVSPSILKENIATLEQAADHLLLAHMTEPEKELHLRVLRSRSVPHLDESILVPFSREVLETIKETADASRVVQIPAIRKI
jgi:KaiC/GvpD/RAD55 family RecA-like ATPase